MKVNAFAFGINPEPWAMGDGSIKYNALTKKNYIKFAPNLTLKQYQDALRSSLKEAGATMLLPNYSIRIWINRQTVNYLANAGGRGNRNQADGTNILKGTEDALQEIVIGNDRDVIHGDWIMMAQDRNVTPRIVIEVGYAIADWSDSFFPHKEMTPEGKSALKICNEIEVEMMNIHSNDLIV